MLRNMQIRSRIIVLVVVQAFVLISIAAINEVSLNLSDKSMEQIRTLSGSQAKSAGLAESLRSGLLSTVSALEAGAITWEEAGGTLSDAKLAFDRAWKQRGTGNLAEAEAGTDPGALAAESLRTAFAELASLVKSRNRQQLSLFMINDFEYLTAPIFSYLQQEQLDSSTATEASILAAHDLDRSFLIGSAVTSALGLLIAGVLGILVYRSISTPVSRISQVVRSVAEGDFSARTDLRGKDELGVLGRAFDDLLQERVATLAQVQQENENLNDSIIALLQAVAQLSQKDLTVEVPVAEDVTGAVADALNLLTQETAGVLQEVTDISRYVASASTEVKVHSDSVLALAEVERDQVTITAQELNETAAALQRIAEVAGETNAAADLAIETTQNAVESVVSTVDGINNSRDMIRETEKRIKRLGERSQEISVAVNLINDIAERTHILALNASMHAASAGEAGRGFAVVADEVQRLAENARQATSQIANLVSSIQAETGETVAAMNLAIGQVVDGSRLAEQAGERMRETQQTTAALVASVQQIAASSKEQAQSSQSLRTHARQIESSTEQTSRKLNEQAQHANQLLEYAERLVASVQLFILPERPVDEEEQALEEAA
jgi:methyl-accepting chemotaxis protein